MPGFDDSRMQQYYMKCEYEGKDLCYTCCSQLREQQLRPAETHCEPEILVHVYEYLDDRPTARNQT